MRAITLVALCSLLASCTPSTSPVPEKRPNINLSVSLGFDDVMAGASRHTELAGRLNSVKATGVSLAVGRPDWVAFDWTAHPDTRAGSAGGDHVANAISRLASNPQGSKRDVTLVIDVFAPRLLQQYPDEAARDADGQASDLQPGAASFYHGEVGRRIVELCGTTAQRYRPQHLALTELFLEDTYSDADLALYRDVTGNDDWPRTSDGAIDENHDSLVDLRVAVVNNLVGRCADAAEPHGVKLEADVRVPWEDPGSARTDSGHDYQALLKVSDRLTVWNYYSINGRRPEFSSELTEALQRSLGEDAMSRVTMSVGLWAEGDGVEGSGAISPEDLAAGVSASATNGVQTVGVTPASLMTDAHWKALAELHS